MFTKPTRMGNWGRSRNDGLHAGPRTSALKTSVQPLWARSAGPQEAKFGQKRSLSNRNVEMKVAGTVKMVRVIGAGNSKGGWGPAGSNAPVSSTREVDFMVEIYTDKDGYLLCCISTDGEFYDDSWHPNLKEAKLTALENLGIELADWQYASSAP